MARKKKKEIIEQLEIESIGFEGISIARNEGMVHFVKGGVPGDILKTRRLRKRKSYFENTLLEVIEPSSDRINPVCEYFDDCGGCSWQNMPYSVQTIWKKQHVIDAFQRNFHFDSLEIREIIGSNKELNYRNKMEFSFGTSRWMRQNEIDSEIEIENKNFALGLHVPGRFDKVLDINKCYIHGENSDVILTIFKKYALKYNIPAYDLRNNNGILRNLIVRSVNNYSEYQVNLVTSAETAENIDLFFDEITSGLQKLDFIKGFLHTINNQKNPRTVDSVKLIFGEEFLFEQILGLKYKISPFSFFQTNTSSLDKFIGEIIKISELNENQIIWDLYCGTGSITLPASKQVKKVIGVELVESSISDANVNKELNNIENIQFYCSDLHAKDIPDLLESFEKPDKIIIDPPRAGMHKNLVDHLLKIESKEIIYVSCNPMTHARDCDLLKDKYEVVFVQPFDMFPQTYHIESIALLKLRN